MWRRIPHLETALALCGSDPRFTTGKTRWVVERTIALGSAIGCRLICWNFANGPFRNPLQVLICSGAADKSTRLAPSAVAKVQHEVARRRRNR